MKKTLELIQYIRQNTAANLSPAAMADEDFRLAHTSFNYHRGKNEVQTEFYVPDLGFLHLDLTADAVDGEYKAELFVLAMNDKDEVALNKHSRITTWDENTFDNTDPDVLLSEMVADLWEQEFQDDLFSFHHNIGDFANQPEFE